MRISIGETHPFPGEGIDVRRLVIVRTKNTAVGPAHVIDQKENDVRRPFRSGIYRRSEAGKAGDEYESKVSEANFTARNLLLEERP